MHRLTPNEYLGHNHSYLAIRLTQGNRRPLVRPLLGCVVYILDAKPVYMETVR